MKTFAPPPWNYDNSRVLGRRVLDRETMAKSLLALLLLAGFVILAWMFDESVQQTRAASDVIGTSELSVSKQQPERSGVLSGLVPVF